MYDDADTAVMSMVGLVLYPMRDPFVRERQSPRIHGDFDRDSDR